MIRRSPTPRRLTFSGVCLACLTLARPAGATEAGHEPDRQASRGTADPPPALAAAAHPGAEPTEPSQAEPAAPPPAIVVPGAAPAADPADHPTPPSAKPRTAATTPAKPRATDEVHGLLNLGPSLTDRGDYDAAEIAFRRVMNFPEVAAENLKSALLGLARMHRKQGALTKAAAIYERYLRDYPGDERSPDVLLDLGRTLRALGIHKIAISRFYSVLNSTLKLNGAGFEHYQLIAKTAQFEIAQTHFEAGNFSDANKYFTRLRLLDLAPADRARAHFMSACSLRLQGDLEAAANALRTFVEQTPRDDNAAEARYLLAVTLRDLHRPQEALAATLELLRAEKPQEATDAKRWAYWQRRTGNQLANDFFESGDTLNAHSIYASLLELSPEPTWRLPLIYQIALCYERLGLLDRAQTSYQSIVAASVTAPPPELAELFRMAAWRLEHLNWRNHLEKQVSAFFTITTGKQAAAPAALPLKSAATP